MRKFLLAGVLFFPVLIEIVQGDSFVFAGMVAVMLGLSTWFSALWTHGCANTITEINDAADEDCVEPSPYAPFAAIVVALPAMFVLMVTAALMVILPFFAYLNIYPYGA